MKKTSFYKIVIAAFMGLFFSSMTFAGDALLLTKHTNVGVTCMQCHGVAAPTTAAPNDTCLSCHGLNYEGLAKITERLDPNPHYTHLGDMPCSECHNNHKPSVNMCSSCHNIQMKVP